MRKNNLQTKWIYFFFVILLIISIVFLINKYLNKKIVKIGILFTNKGGSMEIDEKKLYNILNKYINYYNQYQKYIYIEKYEYNPKSSTELYKKGCMNLINKNVSVIFGCWRTIDRKAIKPIIERENNLLLYPLQYEGNECSKNILYFGACPNQQIDIGIDYAIENISKKIILIGSDYQFPRIANNIIKKYFKNKNFKLLEEIYVDLDEKNFNDISKKICNKYNSERYLIINTINGDSNKYFFESLYNHYQEKSKDKINKPLFHNIYTIMSFSVTESFCKNIKKAAVYKSYFT